MLSIPFYFCVPIICIVFWNRVTTFMAVPKTAVYENGNLLLEENKIWVAFDIVVATPAGDSIFLEDLNELELRRFVILGADFTHDLTAFFFCEYVGH